MAVTSTTSYSANVTFQLSSGDGTKTVYVWFKDAAGNVSGSASDQITLATSSASLVGTWGVGVLRHSNDGTWLSRIAKPTFNSDGTGSSTLQENNNGTIQSRSDTFTYTWSLNSDGSLTVTMNFADGSTSTGRRVISDDGKVMIWDWTDQSDNQRLQVAVKLDTTKTYTSADLQGDYYALGYRYKSSDGTYRGSSGISSFDGSGSRSTSGTDNINGTLSTFSNTKTYSVNSDGKYSIDSDPNGYLLGNGIMGIDSHVNTSDVWSIGGLLKKQDKTYSTADLAGTWALTGFGDDQGTSFHAEFGSITCDNSGNCTSNEKFRSSDGSVGYETNTFSISVASDGSFGGSLAAGAPSYAGAIGNNGNTIVINDSFDQTDLNGRFIGVAVLCSSCSNLVPVSGWSKYLGNPVFSSSGSGAWDDPLRGGSVLMDQDEQSNKYKMWYVGGATANDEGMSIGYATSSDGINWVPYSNNPVMTHGNTWDINGFSGIHVIKDGSTYKLWYEGIDNNGVNRIGYATSSDGINWTPYQNNPVLSPGVNGSWDDEDVGDPWIIKEGSTYMMWYWGDDQQTDTDQIGLATSADGITWQRSGNNPVLSPTPAILWENGEGVGSPTVIKNASGYKMAYHAGDQSGTSRIGFATSSDGVTWNKNNDNPILDIGTGNDWDSVSLFPSSLIDDSIYLKLWYLGTDTSGTLKVGLAVNQ